MVSSPGGSAVNLCGKMPRGNKLSSRAPRVREPAAPKAPVETPDDRCWRYLGAKYPAIAGVVEHRRAREGQHAKEQGHATSGSGGRPGSLDGWTAQSQSRMSGWS